MLNQLSHRCAAIRLVQAKTYTISTSVLILLLVTVIRNKLVLCDCLYSLDGLVRYWNFSFIVSELVQVNSDNSGAMSALTCKYSLLFVGQIQRSKYRHTIQQFHGIWFYQEFADGYCQWLPSTSQSCPYLIKFLSLLLLLQPIRMCK